MNTTNPLLSLMRQHFLAVVPHIEALGIQIDEATIERASGHLPYQDFFVGDTTRNVLHTGVITTLIDTMSGAATYCKLQRIAIIATLDLRVDYLRPAVPEKTLYCSASCYRITKDVAFVRAKVWQDDENKLIAESLSTFMITEISGAKS